jgi:hypothetical protein
MKKSFICFLLLFATICLKAQTAKERGLKGDVRELIEVTKDNESSSTADKTTKRIIIFDKQGYITGDNEYLPDGSLVKRIKYKNERNNQITITEYNKHNNILLKATYSLNDRHQITEIKMESFEGPDKPDPNLKGLLKKKLPPYKNVYKYDQAGNRIEEDSYSGDVVLSKMLYKYDKANKKLKEEMVNVTTGKTEFGDTYIYDTAGNMVGSKGFDATSGKISNNTTTYGKFDKHGNWLEEDHKSPDYNFKKERTIKYY